MKNDNTADFGWHRNLSTIEDELVKQHPTTDGWICPSCVNYKGDLICTKRIFIAYTQANMKGCVYFKQGKKCKHCGFST
jgi:hypothetical protein